MCNVCTHLTHWAVLLPFGLNLYRIFPSLKKHVEASMQDRFSHPTNREKPCGPRCTFEFFESDASPSGGFLLKRETRLSLGLHTGWKEEDCSAPNIMPPVFPVPFLIQFYIAADRWEQPGPTSDRCQRLIGWLTVFTLAALARLTVSTQELRGISLRSTSSILNNATLLEKGTAVAGGCECVLSWGGRCPLGVEWCNLVSYCSAAPWGFKYLPWVQHNDQDRKSVFWCISTVGRFIAQSYP